MTLSQETIAIVTVGLALAGLNITSDIAIRSEAQANRAAIENAIRTLQDSAAVDRRALQEAAAADRRALQEAAAADRRALQEAAATDRRAFQAELLRLTEKQAKLAAVVESSSLDTAD